MIALENTKKIAIIYVILTVSFILIRFYLHGIDQLQEFLPPLLSSYI